MRTRSWLPILLLLTSCGSGGAGSADFRLPTLDGQTLGPPDFAGQVVVVDFWATWCTPCHLQAKILQEMLEETGREVPVQVLAVDVGEPEEVVRSFVADYPKPYPVLLDTREEVSGPLGVVALPSLMIIDPAGEVTYFDAGILPGPRLRELILEAAGA